MKKLTTMVTEKPDTGVSSLLFSVVVPAYQSAPFITEALDSILAQTFKNYEILVVNDGSPDTEELEKELEAYLDRIIYIKQEHKGPAAARNAAIAKAGGEFIAFLDSDDKWFPLHLAQMASQLTEDPTLDLLYADTVQFGDLESFPHTCMELNPSQGEVTFESLVDEKCTVIGSTVVVRRRIVIDVGLFDESLKFGEDFDLWLRIAYRGGRIDYLQNVHGQRRIHSDSLTADAAESFAGQAAVLEKLVRELSLSPRIEHKIEFEIKRCRALVALENGKQKLIARQYAKAWEEFRQANSFFRRVKLYLILFLLRAAPAVLRYFYVNR